jgi:isopentenyl-diphosphate delta-isomerase
MTSKNPPPTPVSFNDEPLILVDAHDNEVGYASKIDAHKGRGQLHRAFSLFLFDGPERVLLQQRADLKPLWPSFWSNSCCSHPRQGESYPKATHRRLLEELGVESELFHIYQFEYQASFGDIGSEHELCSVYVGNVQPGAVITPHPNEVKAWQWFDCSAVDKWLDDDPNNFTPWFKLEWPQLRSTHRATLNHLLCEEPLRHRQS